MSLVVVGISDYQTSNRTDDVIITYSLGSCIGLTVYDPVTKVGGMIHYMPVFPSLSRNCLTWELPRVD
jgi:chemotaxis protein CheD